MRVVLIAAIAACGPKEPSPPPYAVPLPPDKPATPAGETTSECIPDGTYRVTWDFSPATVTGHGGLDDEFCAPMVEGLATQGLAEMKISHPGSLTVTWPGPQNVIELGACAFEITSRSPAVAKVKFSGGTGNGTASFSIETKNHPGERCDVDGATFMLAKQP